LRRRSRIETSLILGLVDADHSCDRSTFGDRDAKLTPKGIALRLREMGGSEAMRFYAAAGALLALLAVSTTLHADDYPARPIHLIIGFPAGSVADVSFRVVDPAVSEKLGQPIIIENRPGAGSGVAAAQAAHSPNDGYTLYVGSSANVFDQALGLNKNFDFYRDFAPIMLAVSAPTVLVVAPGLGIRSVPDLVSYAKAHPGKLSFASAGFGSAAHLSLELFKIATKTDIVHVPYPGSPQVLTDMLAGRVDGFFGPGSTIRGYTESGRLTALAVAEPKRSIFFPDIPTLAEAGVPGADSALWFGYMAPTGTPQVVIDKVSKAANEAMQSEEVVKNLRLQTIEPHQGSPDDFAGYIERERKRWSDVVDKAGLRK
jgi:tripartite-type tricarboxylate transporter receptor subunit TctC